MNSVASEIARMEGVREDAFLSHVWPYSQAIVLKTVASCLWAVMGKKYVLISLWGRLPHAAALDMKARMFNVAQAWSNAAVWSILIVVAIW